MPKCTEHKSVDFSSEHGKNLSDFPLRHMSNLSSPLHSFLQAMASKRDRLLNCSDSSGNFGDGQREREREIIGLHGATWLPMWGTCCQCGESSAACAAVAFAFLKASDSMPAFTAFMDSQAMRWLTLRAFSGRSRLKREAKSETPLRCMICYIFSCPAKRLDELFTCSSGLRP
eukprot:2157521-Amphidinium_carterae.1